MAKFLTNSLFKNSGNYKRFSYFWTWVLFFMYGFIFFHTLSYGNQDNKFSQDLYLVPPSLPSFKIFSQAAQYESIYKELITFKINQKESELDLSFLNSLNTKVAVFQRGHILWIFFDKGALVDIKQTIKNYKDYILDWQTFKNNDRNIIKIHLFPFIKVKVISDSLYWHLILSHKKSIPEEYFHLTISYVSQKEISFSLKSFETPNQHTINMGHLVNFTDPETGDYLTIIPTSSKGVLNTHEYSYFKLLPTYQGIVILHHSDTLDITQNINQIIFTISDSDSDTLNLSQKDYYLKRIPHKPSSFFNLLFKESDLSQFNHQRQLLFDKLMASSKNKNLEIRLTLIKFYLAYGRSQEALGEFKILYEDFPHAKKSPEILALYGLAQGLCGRFNKAIEIFDNPDFMDDPEIILWSQIFQMNNKKYSLSIKNLNEYLIITSDYPNILKKYLYFSLLKLSLKSKNHYSEEYLKILTTLPLSAYESEKLDLYHAYFLKNMNQNEQAFKAFQKLVTSRYPRIQIQALYEYSTFFSDSKNDLSKIINLMEKHRFSWRGDYLEVKILDQLIKFYRQSNQIEKALSLQRQVITYYPSTTEAKNLKEQAQEIIFNFIYKNKSNTPFQCIAFYEKFKDLAPKDQRLNQIKLILIDNYLDLNLISEAQNLLNEEIKSSSDNLESFGPLLIKYSLLQLEEENDSGALKSLKIIETLNLKDPKTLSDKKVLEAQILTKQKEYFKALELLENENSTLGLQQKIDISILAKNWKKAKQFLSMLISLKEEKQELTPDIILNLAVVCYHGHYLHELSELRNKYKDFMSKSPLANDFFIITTPQNDEIPAEHLTPEILNHQLNSAKKFDQFLENYQKNLQKKS